MRKNTHPGLIMPEVIGSYIKMYNPEQFELGIDTLFPMPQNEEIHGPLVFDEAHKLLTESFRQFGQNRHVIVYRRNEKEYRIIDGVRCFHAAKAAGFKELSCLVLNVDDQRAFEVMQILNSGNRRVTYAMKAKKLELLEKHAKQYLLENGTEDNEASKLTVRQYMAGILQMSERYVTEFRAICHHPDKDRLIGEMDKNLMTMNKAAALARNKHAKIPMPQERIPLGKRPVLTCPDCPRRKEFLDMVERYQEEPAQCAQDDNKERGVNND